MESIEGGAMSLRETTDTESAQSRTSAAERRRTIGPCNRDNDPGLATSTASSIRELAVRESDGLHVLLLWNPDDNGLTVSVEDSRSGWGLQLAVAPDRALDAFYHPFAYAA
jgi:hypothetical protein